MVVNLRHIVLTHPKTPRLGPALVVLREAKRISPIREIPCLAVLRTRVYGNWTGSPSIIIRLCAFLLVLL